MADLPRRPAVARSGLATAAAWAQWFGVSRLVAAAVSVLVVVAGGYWLVRSPPPPTEATLPVATTTSDVVVATSLAPAPARPDPVIVHVVGAVRVPGVYELPPGSRVVAAVEAAGGPEPRAVLDEVNLAALLADGQRVHVPLEGEKPLPAFDHANAGGHTSAGGPGRIGGTEAPIDLNRAAVGELVRLPGVGEATATAIVADRERNGPFGSVDDLVRVRGIGPAKLEAVREFVVVR
jgi:competence protein ComEA